MLRRGFPLPGVKPPEFRESNLHIPACITRVIHRSPLCAACMLSWRGRADLAAFDFHSYARRGAELWIAEVVQELDVIYRDYPDLRAKRGERAASPAAGGPGRGSEVGNGRAGTSDAPRRRRRKTTAAQRKAVGERMRRYWAARRRAAGRK
jgi:hypothetical protein